MRRAAKRVATLAVLLAAALVLFLVESLLPPLLPMAPYVKIGLANSFVLLVIALFGVRDGFLFVLAKNLLGALFGTLFAIAFNLAGSVAAFAIMAVLYKFVFPKVSLVGISVAGAVFSNIARTAIGVWLMDAPSLFIQLPAVCIFSVCAGIVVGVLTVFLLKYLPERLTKQE